MSYRNHAGSRALLQAARRALLVLALIMASGAFAHAEGTFAHGFDNEPPAHARGPEGKSLEPGHVSSKLADGSLWTYLGDTKCDEAAEVGLWEPGVSPTPQRIADAKRRIEVLRIQLEAQHTLRLCLARDKAGVIARFSGDSPASQEGHRKDLYALEEMQIMVERKITKDEGEKSFLGLRLGVGVGVSFSEDDVVSDAEIGAGNVIASTKNERQQPRVILESHYYGWTRKGRGDGANRSFGIGPYFGIVAKESDLISAFGTGVMFGWKDPDAGDPRGFSIGIGAVLDAGVKSLARGFEDGKRLPAGETSIRFEEKSRWSALLFFTRTF